MSTQSATEDSDRATVRTIAERYETARARGDWETAWSLLSPDARQAIGSIDDFASAQAAYNAAGGTVFEIAEPTRDPDLLSEAFLGDPYRDVEQHGDVSRAYLVFISHPNVRGASAASTALIVAPANGTWLVWIAR